MSTATTTATRAGFDWIALACLLATGTLLGLATNLAKLAGEAGLPALPFLGWSIAGAALLLGPVVAIGSGLPRLTARTAEYFVVAGLVSVAAPNLILFAAVPHVGAGFAALAIAFPPLYTYVMALALGMERFCAWRAAGVAIALSGAVLLAAFKFAAPQAATGWIVATMLAPVILAVGNIYRTARWPAGARPEQLAPGMLVASVLLLAGFALATGSGGPVPTEVPDGLPIVAAQSVAFALQYLLFFVLQKRGGPVYLSLLGSVSAIVGVPIAVLLLGEAWPRGIVVGALLIITGIALVSRRRA
jgi:drug/metabolite transporter (DMT)-like permease